jgi:2-methylisocitrate lyase-like PEP mutase family enzyme
MSLATDGQAARAAEFAAAHTSGPIVVLPNAFDVATARLIARREPVALGTTSAAIAAGLGYPDGEVVSRDEMIGVVERIVAAVPIGVTVDVEAGYGDTVEDAAETARRILEIGAIGLNIEDRGNPSGEHAGRLLPIEHAAAKIAAIRAIAEERGVPLVINARTDTFIEDGDQVARAIERGNAYLEAGADCVFTPGIVARDDIARAVAGLAGPLNIYASAATPPVSELSGLGVRRLSVGCGPYQACLALIDEAARQLLEDGRYEAFTADQLSSADLTALF